MAISDIVSNNNLQTKKMYLFVAHIYGNLSDKSFKISFKDSNINKIIGELIFKGKEKIKCCPICIKDSLTKQFFLEIENLSPNSILIISAKLIPLLGNFEIMCASIDTGGPRFYYGNDVYYCLNTGIFNYSYQPQQSFFVTPNDYFKNERLFYKRNGNGFFHFWCEDQTVLIDGLTDAYISTLYNEFIGFDSARSAICKFVGNLQFDSNVDFYKISGNDKNSFIV